MRAFEKRTVATVFGVMCLASSMAWGATYHMVPTPADLYDLDHSSYYTWGINRPWLSVETPVSATLTFTNISNWDNNSNVLYIHLLDEGTLGVTSGIDNEGGGDYFAGKGILLKTYKNLTTTPRTLTYSFTDDQLDTLAAYAFNGRFALGFDPDCHYYNSGISLDVVTSQVPEPGSIALMLLGAVGFIKRPSRGTIVA